MAQTCFGVCEFQYSAAIAFSIFTVCYNGVPEMLFDAIQKNTRKIATQTFLSVYLRKKFYQIARLRLLVIAAIFERNCMKLTTYAVNVISLKFLLSNGN